LEKLSALVTVTDWVGRLITEAMDTPDTTTGDLTAMDTGTSPKFI
jgi:hypothetical protein